MNKHFLLRHLRNQGFSEHIVQAFAAAKREDFISRVYQSRAYEDFALPTIADQTISQPSTIAFMLSLLELEMLKEKHVKILEIGSGSGYVLALLHAMLPKAELYGIELQKELAVSSRRLLHQHIKIHIIEGSGVQGLPGKAPFDRILVSASAFSLEIPRALCEQLKDFGILVSPVRNSIFQLKKHGKTLEEQEFEGFVFVPLKNV